MMLTELTQIAPEALPVAELSAQLKLGSGFGEDAVQDALLEALLRAAMAAIEARTGKALLTRDMRLELMAWRDLARQSLPLAPVSAIAALVIMDRDGTLEEIDPVRYRLEQDTHRPRLCATGLVLPTIPVGGAARIDFTAGFGIWSDLPADLAQAVLRLAAHMHDHRDDSLVTLPSAIEALIGAHRNIRLFGGGRG